MATMIKVLEVQVGNKEWVEEANCFKFQNDEQLVTQESFGTLIGFVLHTIHKTNVTYSIDPYGSTGDYYLNVHHNEEKMFAVVFRFTEVPDFKYNILKSYEAEAFKTAIKQFQ